MNKPVSQLGREEQAKIEIGHTAFPRLTAWLMITVFLFLVGSVPLIQQASDIRAYVGGKRASAWPPAYSTMCSIVGRQCYDFFRRLPSALRLLLKADSPSRIIQANRGLLRDMRAYEDALEDESLVGNIVRAPAQYVLARWLGAGNERAYCGRGAWLFFRTDTDYLIGPGFLNASWLSWRVASADEWVSPPQPDPVKAIVHFNEQLAGRGIRLIVMPTPVKPVIHPEKFARAYENWRVPVQNPSFARFVRELEQQGVLVFDCAADLVNAARPTRADQAVDQSQYLAADTHWRPEAVELIARRLKAFIQERAPLPDVPASACTARRMTVMHLGDIALMLKLPARQTFYPAEQARIRQILARNNSLWLPDASADVLVLGDSFSNIYSLEPLGWGESAGLIEQLSFELQRPLDRIVQNDNGAYATRAMLNRELARGRDRLAGKRLVIYQFACRELTEGDWKIIDLSLGAPGPARFVVPESGAELVVRGMVKTVSPVPRPGTVPYKDHIMCVHLVDLCPDESAGNGQAVVYMRSMTDNVWTRAVRYRPGDMIQVRLKPWSDVAGQYEGINRTEPDDETLLLQDPCWGEEYTPSPGSNRRQE